MKFQSGFFSGHKDVGLFLGIKDTYTNFYKYMMMSNHYILSPTLLRSQQGKSRPKNVKDIMNVCEIKRQVFLVDWAYFLA